MSHTSNKSDNKEKPQDSHKMWGGRFQTQPHTLMQAINASIDFDKKLASQDIRGSRAHADMLAAQNIISAADNQAIQDGLDQIEADIQVGTFRFSHALEDIHLNIEARLKEMIGDAGARLHTGRSRNDQVATDLRLWMRDYLDQFDQQIHLLIEALLGQATEHSHTLMPGFTHLQNAQPITLAHHLLAYVEMFYRDQTRFQDSRKRLNECPLGAAALAGTSYPIDRHMSAKALGFIQPMANSLDAVSARDFAQEVLANATICATHLSRLAEEIVIWSSTQFNFIYLSDAFTTGSSIMPQKRNPDAAELIRAKIGRIMGAFTTLTLVMKGLPLAYCKDMQEDKEPVFDALNALDLALAAMTGMIADMQVNTDVMAHAAGADFSTATDLADWLVQTLHIPFRDAHHITGKIVTLAETQKCTLHELDLATLQTIEPRITKAVFGRLSSKASIASRNSYGGTAPSEVEKQLRLWQNRLAR